MKIIAFNINGVQIGPTSVNNIALSAGGLGGHLFGTLINIFLFVIIIVFSFIIVYSGIKWIMSSGEEKNVEQARNAIVQGAIGLAIAMLAYFFLNIVSHFVGFSLLGS